MKRAPWTSTSRGLLAVAAGGCAVVVVAVLVLGLDFWTAAALVVVVALAGTSWSLVRLRGQRSRLALEVHNLEVSTVLLNERIRVAREVHDLVSHGLGMITVRASSAVHLAGQQGDLDALKRERLLLEALSDIEEASREATTGLRRTLQTLRDPDEAAALRPVESLDDLGAVINSAETAGLMVTCRRDDLSGLPQSVQAAIVSVVREGLVNAVRHAGPTEVSIGLERQKDAVVVTVRDAGPEASWKARPGSGHGLMGLRERVAALGGTMTAEPDPSGRGHLLRASFEDVRA